MGHIKKPETARSFSLYSEHKISLTSLMTVYSICSYTIMSQNSLFLSLSLFKEMSNFQNIILSVGPTSTQHIHTGISTCVWSHQVLSKMTEFHGIWDEYYVMSRYPTNVHFNLGTQSCQTAVAMPQMMTTCLNCTSFENVIFLYLMK